MDIKQQLVNPYANKQTKELFNYLISIYGNKVIAGQQMYHTAQREEQVIFEQTGKCPALKGFDFIGCTHNENTQVDMAINFYKESRGIVTFCWHWCPPKDVYSFYTKSANEKHHTNFDIRNAVNPECEEYALVMKDIDIIAAQIMRLQKEGIPFLFRPLHEAAGGWFWWGAHGSEPYKKLWNMIYDRYTNYYKFDNIIWIWNSESPEWLVDENTYDIAGVDVYSGNRNYNNREKSWDMLTNVVGERKLKTLSENDAVPLIDKMFEDKITWLYWCVWWGGFAWTDNANDFDYLRQVYNHERVVTLDKLPWFDKDKHKLGQGAQIVLKNNKEQN